MIQMGTEFVLMISSVGYEFAEKEGMTTIAPRHIVAALVDLGYGEYVDEIEELIELLKAEAGRKVCYVANHRSTRDDDRADEMG